MDTRHLQFSFLIVCAIAGILNSVSVGSHSIASFLLGIIFSIVLSLVLGGGWALLMRLLKRKITWTVVLRYSTIVSIVLLFVEIFDLLLLTIEKGK